MGDYSKALSYYEQTLELELKTLGPNHPSVATTYGSLGMVYSDMCDYSKALSYYEKTLEVMRKSLPATHPSINFGLQTIADIQSKSDIFETSINQTKDKCHLLESYNQKTSDEELAILKSLDNRWHEISLNSKHRDAGLKRVKGRSGSTHNSSELNQGLKLMKTYRDELKRLEIDKQELTNAEKLFNLPISSYPELYVIQKEMKNLEKLYTLYEQQPKSRELWSETL
ncbi:unnamed protein product [Didymodactylos carnosus]|uniref:Kinesin light chain n=2 Tax=Didymodactylos carnosus TaxID=1234261 RepID=A0A815ME03_9BILA|nr:unnamed protein product [Didymodactylos carnosus]CAF4302362.1 unnamed protein product [Didymodactylos carnosus]